jgi:uncharacterized membrane protein YkoI
MRNLCGLFAVAALVAAACETTETRVTHAGEAHPAETSKGDAVPANVLEAAKNAVPGLVVTGTESEVEHGVRIYDVTGTADGTAYEIEVTADGKVTEIEEGGDDGDEDEDDDE